MALFTSFVPWPFYISERKWPMVNVPYHYKSFRVYTCQLTSANSIFIQFTFHPLIGCCNFIYIEKKVNLALFFRWHMFVTIWYAISHPNYPNAIKNAIQQRTKRPIDGCHYTTMGRVATKHGLMQQSNHYIPRHQKEEFLTHNTLPTEGCPLFHGPRWGHQQPQET